MERERRAARATALFGPHAIGRVGMCGGVRGGGVRAAPVEGAVEVWGRGSAHQWKERWKYETIRCSDLMKYVSTEESASVGFSYRKLCATWEGG